ncbi:hypothetical protein J31TS4_43620 [Paenibacillus sp. J31TS4]|nr:hypothetical protein J31TS4_43620 [Paenibacillus sp. J31TS4]
MAAKAREQRSGPFATPPGQRHPVKGRCRRSVVPSQPARGGGTRRGAQPLFPQLLRHHISACYKRYAPAAYLA